MAFSFLPRAPICLRCQTKQFLSSPTRTFTISSNHAVKQLPPRRQIPESDIHESFLCGSGPGGQKINKTASAVQLKHLPSGLVVKCQATRSRDQNRKTARKILAEKLEVIELGEGSRTMIKAREVARKKASKKKKSGRKYRALEAGKEGREDREDGDGEVEQGIEEEATDKAEVVSTETTGRSLGSVQEIQSRSKPPNTDP